jgi:glycosyltransferase involved in cell wall biosynthesis
MTVGIYFNKPGVFEEHKEAVSAHIQLPIKTYGLLKNAGHDVRVYTTRPPDNQILPDFFHTIKTLDVRLLIDPNRQGRIAIVKHGHKKGIRLGKFIRHLSELSGQIKKDNIATLLVFGTFKFALAASILKLLNFNVKLIWVTEFEQKNVPLIIETYFRKCFSVCFSTTKYVQSHCGIRQGIKYLPRGILRSFNLELNEGKNRVTFWRDPSFENGADLALSVFENLAPLYPDIIFTFAIRPHWDSLVPRVHKLKNIEVHQFPYESPITLAGLLSESICVISPYRSLSVNPQLALVETLMAGIPVVSSNVESCAEYLENADLDFTLTTEVDEFIICIKSILDSDKSKTSDAYRPNLEKLNSEYNWCQYADRLSSEI